MDPNDIADAMGQWWWWLRGWGKEDNDDDLDDNSEEENAHDEDDDEDDNGDLQGAIHGVMRNVKGCWEGQSQPVGGSTPWFLALIPLKNHDDNDDIDVVDDDDNHYDVFDDDGYDDYTGHVIWNHTLHRCPRPGQDEPTGFNYKMQIRTQASSSHLFYSEFFLLSCRASFTMTILR